MTQSSPDRRTWVLAALERYEGPLVRYAARLLADAEAARDVVQHAFLRLCDEDPTRLEGREAAWLYTVCRNKALDLLRRDGSRNGTVRSLERAHGGQGGESWAESAVSSESDPADAAEAGELHGLLRRLVAELPENQREAVELWSHGLAYEEIAGITGRTQGNVRVLVHRAIARLRQHPQVRKTLFEEEAVSE